MHVEYQLTPDDLYAFQWRAMYRSPAGRRSRRKLLLVFFLSFLVIAVTPAIGRGGFAVSQINWIFLAVAFPLVSVLYMALERFIVRRVLLGLVRRERPDKGLLGTHTLVLSESGLVETTAVGESRSTWEGIDRVEQDDSYVFIYTSVVAAHIVPKRTFGAGQAEAFFQLARRLKDEAAA